MWQGPWDAIVSENSSTNESEIALLKAYKSIFSAKQRRNVIPITWENI